MTKGRAAATPPPIPQGEGASGTGRREQSQSFRNWGRKIGSRKASQNEESLTRRGGGKGDLGGRPGKSGGKEAGRRPFYTESTGSPRIP